MNSRWIDRLLEIGVGAVVVFAPLPFGSVSATGRLVLEMAAFALLLVWGFAAWTGPFALPPKRVLGLLGGLLLLGSLQTLPLPDAVIRAVSPQTVAVRESTLPDRAALDAESALLGVAPTSLDAEPTLSVEPGATASALRTGAALCALLIVASHVAATRGLRVLFLMLLFSAAFQALYGLIVLASGYDRIWNVAKKAYLDSATGTFVNRNHFANYLAMALPCGAALWVAGLQRTTTRNHQGWFVRTFSSAGSRNLMGLLALLIGVAGLLVSFSRAGIALGVAAVAATLWLGLRSRAPKTRFVIVVLALAIALIPLAQLGSDALWNRFENSAQDFSTPGSRGTVWRDTFELARAFPVFGSGFGTFAAVYPKYRSPEVRFFWTHAHNDLLQFAAEGGAIGAILLLALLASLGRRIFAAIRGEFGLLGIGVGVGLSATLLHALIDFNFHLPANAALAVVLAGSLWGLSSKHAS